jgi:hypothetical protein
MPPKPSPRGSSGRRKADDPFRIEQKRLLDEQEALIRKQEEARRVIEDAPRKLQQLKKRQREPILINLKASRAGQKSFGLPHDKYREAAAEPRQRRKRKSERNMAKLQFIILCAIFLAIVLMMLRAIPQQ